MGLPLDQLSDKELTRRPNAMAVETLQKVCKVQGERETVKIAAYCGLQKTLTDSLAFRTLLEVLG